MGLYDWTPSKALAPGLIRRQGKDTPYNRSGSEVFQSGEWRGIRKDLVSAQGQITPTAIPKHGSNAVAISDAGFAFVAQNPFVDTVTLYWDGTNGSRIPTIQRTDGSSQSIPAGNVTISGLAPSTTYYILPYWSHRNPCSIGWSVGTVGTPMICFLNMLSTSAVLQQNLQNNEPLTNGFASFTTPANGGSGGGGTGGGGYRPCVMIGTDIETLDGVDHTETLYKCADWWHLVVKGGASLFCTPDHPIYDHEGFRRMASSFQVGHFVTMKYGEDEIILSEPHTRVCTKVQVSMPRIKMYFANGFLSHNFKPLPYGNSQGQFYVNGN